LAKITDTLYIGKIKILDSTGSAIYSDQVVETIEAFDKRTELPAPTTADPNATKRATTIDKINDNLLSIINEKYDIFDKTYIVPKKD
jgi:hypothetical protein